MEFATAGKEEQSRRTFSKLGKLLKDWTTTARKDTELFLSFVFGIVALSAIIGNIGVKGISAENVLDGIKDGAGLAVTIVVFLIAHKMYKEMTTKDFVKRFEGLLADWAAANHFLIDTDFSERGKENIRCYDMVTNPASIVLDNKTANKSNRDKGKFLTLPSKKALQEGAHEIIFHLNKSTLQAKRSRDSFTDQDLHLVATQIKMRIEEEFEELRLQVDVPGQLANVRVKFAALKPTEENAEKLLALVELVKTMVLSLAQPAHDYMEVLHRAFDKRRTPQEEV